MRTVPLHCTALQVATQLPTVASELVQRLADLLRAYNSRSCQLVLGAGALHCAGLKSVRRRGALHCQTVTVYCQTVYCQTVYCQTVTVYCQTVTVRLCAVSVGLCTVSVRLCTFRSFFFQPFHIDYFWLSSRGGGDREGFVLHA